VLRDFNDLFVLGKSDTLNPHGPPVGDGGVAGNGSNIAGKCSNSGIAGSCGGISGDATVGRAGRLGLHPRVGLGADEGGKSCGGFHAIRGFDGGMAGRFNGVDPEHVRSSVGSDAGIAVEVADSE